MGSILLYVPMSAFCADFFKIIVDGDRLEG